MGHDRVVNALDDRLRGRESLSGHAPVEIRRIERAVQLDDADRLTASIAVRKIIATRHVVSGEGSGVTLERFELPRTRPLMNAEDPPHDLNDAGRSMERPGAMAEASPAAVFEDRHRRAESSHELLDRPVYCDGPPSSVGNFNPKPIAVPAERFDIRRIGAGLAFENVAIRVRTLQGRHPPERARAFHVKLPARLRAQPRRQANVAIGAQRGGPAAAGPNLAVRSRDRDMFVIRHRTQVPASV